MNLCDICIRGVVLTICVTICNLFSSICGICILGIPNHPFRKSMLLNSSNFHYLKAEDFHFCLTTSEKENQWEKKIIPRKC